MPTPTTQEQMNSLIDQEITNQTGKRSITPTILGALLKTMIQYVLDRLAAGFGLYIEKTYAQAQAAIASNALVKGAMYKITDRGDRGIFLWAISGNKFSPAGIRQMLCPKDYSIHDEWIGVWHNTKSAAAGNLTIRGGLVWENLTGAIGTAVDDFNLDGTNWSVKSKSAIDAGDYYTEISMAVKYDFANDWIMEQSYQGNIVGMPSSVLIEYQPCDVTDWNAALTGGMAFIYNTIAGGFYNNETIGGGGIFSETSCSIVKNNLFLTGALCIRNRVNNSIAGCTNGGVSFVTALTVENCANQGELLNIQTSGEIVGIPATYSGLTVGRISDYKYGNYSGMVNFEDTPLADGAAMVIGWAWNNRAPVVTASMTGENIVTDNNSATDELKISHASSDYLSGVIDDIDNTIGIQSTGALRRTFFGNPIILTSTGGNISDGELLWNIQMADIQN